MKEGKIREKEKKKKVEEVKKEVEKEDGEDEEEEEEEDDDDEDEDRETCNGARRRRRRREVLKKLSQKVSQKKQTNKQTKTSKEKEKENKQTNKTWSHLLAINQSLTDELRLCRAIVGGRGETQNSGHEVVDVDIEEGVNHGAALELGSPGDEDGRHVPVFVIVPVVSSSVPLGLLLKCGPRGDRPPEVGLHDDWGDPDIVGVVVPRGRVVGAIFLVHEEVTCLGGGREVRKHLVLD